MIRLMSGMKPMSSIRSASSSTKISTWPRLTLFCSTWSSSRPGVATRISTPARTIGSCWRMSTPPNTHGRAQVRVLAVFLDLLLDLDRELARRREDQRAHVMAGGRGARVRVRQQLLQDRQAEARRLAGAGLGAAHDVVAGEYLGNRLRLDRRGRRIAGLGRRPAGFRAASRARQSSLRACNAPGRGLPLRRFPVQAAR